MYPEFYERISAPFRQRHNGARALTIADKALVIMVAVTFLGIGAWLAMHHDARTVRYLVVCAVSFAGLSALRAGLNRPRPYETHAINPLIKRGTRGKSFPSRHVFSAAVISCALLWLNMALGVAGFIATAALSALRVVGGVHFPRDVIVGTALGIVCGLIGFWII